MQLAAGPGVKDVVLVGAGHAHVAVLRRFGMTPLPGVRFTLIARELHTPYSGMLPGLVAGVYGFDDAHIDTGPLARFADARLYHDTAIGLDLANKWVICRDRPPVPYDLVSLDMGSTPNTGFVPGAAEHAIPVKPISAFLPRLDTLIARVCGQKGRARLPARRHRRRDRGQERVYRTDSHLLLASRGRFRDSRGRNSFAGDRRCLTPSPMPGSS